MRKELASKEEQIKKLESDLKALDSKTLKAQAVELSIILFDNYMECVFKKLGFDGTSKWNRRSVSFGNINNRLGEDWWKSDKIEINIEANVSKLWRIAFLSIGVKTD